MNREPFSVLRAQTLAVVLLLACGHGYAQPNGPSELNERFSGSFFVSNDIDVNGDGEGGSRTFLHGNSRQSNNGGPSRIQYQVENDTLPWDGQTFCDFDDTGNPVAVEIVYIHSTFVRRTSNADLLYVAMSSSPPSTLCFNFVDNSYTLELFYEVIGGEGIYEGASGQIRTTASGTQFSPTMGGLIGEMKGSLQLP